MPAGRPSSYTFEKAQAICNRIANGETLLAITETPGAPCYHTIYKWLTENEEFMQLYTRARATQAHNIAEAALNEAIAARKRGDDPAMARLAFDARRWYAGKIAPKVYGDKQIHTGSDGEGPIVIMTGIVRDAPDAAD